MGELSKGKKRKGGNLGKKDVECWGCGKKGHFCNKCPDHATKDNKKGKSLSQNAVNAVASDEEGAWAAEEVAEDDWFCVDDEEDLIEGESCEEVVELGDTSEIVLVAEDSTKPREVVELYDSGCTNHISPYCDHFENFQNIVPQKF